MQQQAAPTTPDETRLTRSTLVVMAGLAAAILAGLVRQPIVASAFGTSTALDAFFAANTIPELLAIALSGGALSFAFIPVYTRTLGDPQQANNLFSQVLNAIFGAGLLACAAAALAAPALIGGRFGVAPGFDAEAQALTAELMRILLVSTAVFCVSGIVTGALHAHQHFLAPAFAPVMYTGGIIFGALVLAPGMGIYGLAWGAVIGALLHLSIQVPALISHRIRWRPTIDFSNPDLQRVAILMLPRVADLILARASIDWINANIASGLGEGRISALRYGFQLMNMPWTLIGTAIGIAVFPTMAALAAQKDINAQRQALSGALRAILTLAIPAAAGLLLLGRPVIRILFERGEFTPESTELVYTALQFYMVALLSQSLLEVVVRAYAAQEDTTTPLIISLFTTTLNIGLAVWLSRTALSHGGLALANGLAVGVEATIGLFILHRRWGSINAGRILGDAGKAALAAALMSGVIFGLARIVDSNLLLLLVGGIAGLIVYFFAALGLGIKEIYTIPLSLLRRRAAPESV